MLALYCSLLIPTFGAVVMALIGQRRQAGIINICLSSATLVATLFLALTFLHASPILSKHQQFYIDAFNLLLVILTALITTTTAIFSNQYMWSKVSANVISKNQLRLYHVMYQIFTFMILVTLTTNNIGLLWVAMEGSTLATVLLVSLYRTPHAVEAAWKYFILCIVGIALALFGIILLYSSAAQLLAANNSAILWTFLYKNAGVLDEQIVKLAFVFLLVGYGTKMGLVPLNNWLPDAYSESPAPVTALLSGLLSTASLYTLIRFKIVVDLALNTHLTGYLMMGFGLLSFLVAAILIHRQKNIKRIFSYSSIEHIGLITFGFGLGGTLATFSAVFYMLMHALVKSCIFINIGNIAPSNQTQIGLIRRQPFIGWCLLLATLAICGFPPFGIFTSELLLFMATVNSFPWLTVLLILGLIAAFSGLLRNLHFVIYGDGNNYLSSSPLSLSSSRRRGSNTFPNNNSSKFSNYFRHLSSTNFGTIIKPSCDYNSRCRMTKKHHAQIEFIANLVTAQIIPIEHKVSSIGSFSLITIHSNKWRDTFSITATKKYRLVGIWAQDLCEQLQITACIEHSSEYLLLRTSIPIQNPTLPSITPYFLSANRLERHIYDMFGIEFIDHPDKKRWTRHQAWQDRQFPLRKNFPKESLSSSPTSSDIDYPFYKSTGTGTYEIPVGPIHAGIIESGHLRFQAAGEDIINLEIRLGYKHKGIEKIAEGRNAAGLIKLAARVSGDSTSAHAWAACMAYENAYAIPIPERALYLRAIIAERERIANHLGDFAAICNDVGFSFAYYQFTRLKELWLRMNSKSFGHRFMMDIIQIGGVSAELSETNKSSMQQQLVEFKQELNTLYPIIENNSSLHDRLKTTGILSSELAHQYGCLGYVGRASGSKLDLRHDAPYAPYDKLNIKVPIYSTGDVLARTRIRAQEILVSLELISNLLHQLPSGNIITKWQQPHQAAEGIGLIEGWRGEILAYISFDNTGKVERYFPRDPSWFSWPALERLVHGNIVPDFPVCNKSINGSYSGVDL